MRARLPPPQPVCSRRSAKQRGGGVGARWRHGRNAAVAWDKGWEGASFGRTDGNRRALVSEIDEIRLRVLC